jgi:hypothetical protein
MSDWRKTYWQRLTAIGRVVGLCFVLAGGLFTFWGLSLVSDSKATIDVNGVPNSDPWIKAITLVMGLVVCGLGVILLVARPFKPKE